MNYIAQLQAENSALRAEVWGQDGSRKDWIATSDVHARLRLIEAAGLEAREAA